MGLVFYGKLETNYYELEAHFRNQQVTQQIKDRSDWHTSWLVHIYTTPTSECMSAWGCAWVSEMLQSAFIGRNTMSPLMDPIHLAFLSNLSIFHTTVSLKQVVSKNMEFITIFKVVGIYESAYMGSSQVSLTPVHTTRSTSIHAGKHSWT